MNGSPSWTRIEPSVASYPLEVTEVRDLGIIESWMFTPKGLLETDHEAAERFATQIIERLAVSKKKDVYVYVHGYKAAFENPLLVASELWHFLGYEGVMIAFSWPSTPSKWAYFSDTETASRSISSGRTRRWGCRAGHWGDRPGWARSGPANCRTK